LGGLGLPIYGFCFPRKSDGTLAGAWETMRIRTVKPEFWSHPVMAKLDDSTRLLAIGLLNYSDDEGYFYAQENLVRSALRPFDDESTIIRASLKTLSKIGYIELVETDSHGVLGVVKNFTSHQRVDRPKKSHIKELYNSTNNRRIIDDESPNDLRSKGREGKGNKNSVNACFDLPEKYLHNKPLVDAWTEFQKRYKKKTRLTLSEITRDKQFSKLEEWGENKFLEGIQKAIDRGWQDIFDPHENGFKNGNGHSRIAKDYEDCIPKVGEPYNADDYPLGSYMNPTLQIYRPYKTGDIIRPDK
jgi:hypothetical protein